jgi:hypothetical protein
MRHGKAIAISNWMRRQRARIAMLLSLTVLFNTATAFAIAASGMAPETTTAMAGPAHDMQSPCCPDHAQHKTACCHGATCDCTAHCTSLLLSQQLPVLQTRFKQALPQFADNMPLPHIDPPPQRPPRA